eukprot:11204643-Lingulodinium_polyedra.AAC.1
MRVLHEHPRWQDIIDPLYAFVATSAFGEVAPALVEEQLPGKAWQRHPGARSRRLKHHAATLHVIQHQQALLVARH